MKNNEKFDAMAVVVTHNPDIVLLSRNVRVLLSQADVCVVDNCSSNAGSLALSMRELGVDVVVREQNFGLADSQNFGINIARSSHHKFVILFDQDSCPEIDLVPILIGEYSRLKKDGVKVGALGPLAVDERNGENYRISVYNGWRLKELVPVGTDLLKPAFLIASGCLIPLEVLDRTGDMRPDFFIDYIDIEWSFRARALGYELFVVPTTKLHHAIGDKRVSIFGRRVSLHSPKRRYYLTRNALLMARLPYVSRYYRLRELVLVFLRFVVMFALAGDRVLVLKFFLSGLRDGIIGRGGELR